MAFSEIEKAKVLVAVHMWDLAKGGDRRDYKMIRDVAQISQPVSGVISTFQHARSSTDLWFPYPIIQNIDFQDPKRRQLLFDNPPYEFAISPATMQDRVVEIRKATLLVEPWAMKTWQVRHFLGFSGAPSDIQDIVALYEDAFEEALKLLPTEKLNEFAATEIGAEAYKTDYEVTREMRKLIAGFRLDKEPLSPSVRLDDGVQALTDVSYYRRNLYGRSNIVPVRQTLSDFELIELFKSGLQHEFDWITEDAEDWNNYIEEAGIENFNGLDARSDFFRLCLPRLEILLPWLAPSLDVSNFSFDDNVLLSYQVIFHSCKSATFIEVLRTISLMLHNGWIELEALGGVGAHFCSFNFIMSILNSNHARKLKTSSFHLSSIRSAFKREICTNYNKFLHGFRPDPPKPKNRQLSAN